MFIILYKSKSIKNSFYYPHLGGMLQDQNTVQPLIQIRQEKMQDITVLLVFLWVVIIAIYLITLLLIFFRKFRSIFKSRRSTKVYYSVVLVYIASKMILCSIMLIHIITEMPKWENISGEDIEMVLKNSIQLADLTILQLFFIALYYYLKLCFLAMDKNQTKRMKRALLYGVKLMVFISSMAFLIPLIVFDCKLINYELLNLISTFFNFVAIMIFLASFFFLNFKMTGLMVQAKLNTVIKKIYKVLVIILISRIIMVTVQMIIAFKIHDGTFESFMEFFEQNNGQFLTLGMCFIGAAIVILLTQGLPIMYSLKNSVLEAFSLSMLFHSRNLQTQESIISSNSSALTEDLLKDNIFEYDEEPQTQTLQHLSIKKFKNLFDIGDKEDSIWSLKRGQINGQDFIIKEAKHQISAYIFQDVQTEVAKWNQLKLKYLNTTRYFMQNDHLHLVEKYLSKNIDTMVDQSDDDRDVYLLALEIAKGIEELHKNEIIHGCLKPSYILFDTQRNLYLTGLGLLSFKKYLSLITGYTNKSMYSATEVLADKNNVTIKATKQCDIYSFGMIFYQMITKNRIYREQTLKQCKDRFCDQKARPKIPESLNIRTKALIRNCWQDSPAKRPTISEVILNLKKIIQEI